MFRKPKKTSFRSNKKRRLTPSTSSADNGEKPSTKKKQFRKRANSDSSDEEQENSNTKNQQTSLLQQIKEEQQQQKHGSAAMKSKSKITSHQRKNATARVMDHFESKENGDLKQWTAKDLATRGAEFHPTTATGTSSTKENSAASTNKEKGEGAENQKLYKGQTNVRCKFLAGPLKAPSFVRTTSRFDYQPDICKDYKDTGFCGFGDTCIYLHDRGDTMTGWQLEEEWEKKKKRARDRREKELERFATGGVGCDGDEEEDGLKEGGGMDDGIPFACYVCRNPFTDPVVTKCGHYFCQSCIINHVQGTTEQGCPICKKDTFGVFNHPTKLVSKKRKLVGSRGTWKEFAEAIQKEKS